MTTAATWTQKKRGGSSQCKTVYSRLGPIGICLSVRWQLPAQQPDTDSALMPATRSGWSGTCAETSLPFLPLTPSCLSPITHPSPLKLACSTPLLFLSRLPSLLVPRLVPASGGNSKPHHQSGLSCVLSSVLTFPFCLQAFKHTSFSSRQAGILGAFLLTSDDLV